MSTPWDNWVHDFQSLSSICKQIHADNRAAGWWDGKATLETYATKIALIHSEASEMLEGLRKGQQDDHLPDHSMEAVEAADIFIRLADYCAARDIDLGRVVRQKLLYNQQRQDHKRSVRAAAGGKKF